MPRKATGTTYQDRSSRWYARVTLGPKKRIAFMLPATFTPEQAEARLAILAPLAVDLRAAGVDAVPLEKLLRFAAEAADGKPLARILAGAEAIIRGEARPKPAPAAAALVTFGAVAARWTSGELARTFADHVRAKRRTAGDESYLDRHILPHVRDVPIVRFTVDDAQRVMSGLPLTLDPSTRRAIVIAMSRVLSLAVFPLRIITTHPIPKGFVPNVGKKKARAWLYPDEDRRLLACAGVDLAWRVLYAFLAREGLRYNEAAALTWSDLDLARGVVNLDQNKTDDPRSWALSPGVAAALLAWKMIRARRMGREVRGDDPVLVGPLGGALGEPKAWRFREHLLAAGVDRSDLTERTPERKPIRVHDLRAGFITLALAAGRTEVWVADRTGHRSSSQIHNYRRRARTAAELGLGELAPMVEAIPELAGETGNGSGNGSEGDHNGSSERGKKADPCSTTPSIAKRTSTTSPRSPSSRTGRARWSSSATRIGPA